LGRGLNLSPHIFKFLEKRKEMEKMIETGDLGEIKRVKVELKGESDYSPDSEYFREIAEKFLRYAWVEVVDEGYDAVLRVESEWGTGKVSFISGVIEFSAQFRSETFITAMTELILKIFGIQPLKKVLKRESRELRAEVAKALGKIGDARAVDALIEALKDEDSDVYWNSIDALVKIAKKDLGVVDKLIKALKDEDSYVRISVAWALGEIGDASAVDALIEALRDEDSYVRESIAWALGAIGDARAVDSLIKTLKDDDYFVRESAKVALFRILGVYFEYDKQWMQWWKENEGKFLK
jgi:vesicle coat complex subunit